MIRAARTSRCIQHFARCSNFATAGATVRAGRAAAAAADSVRGHQRRFAQAATQDAPLPRLYLGTMTFGWSQASQPVGDAVAAAMMKSFVEAGGVELDTARIYSAGDTEQIIGRIFADPRRDFSVDGFNIGTKAHPSQPGGLTEEGIRRQVQKSLEAMGVDRVGVLYLHQPDPDCDLVESLECVHSLVEEGVVAELGLSNYSAIEVQRCCDICAERGLTPPSYYQGLYNPLNRAVEEELLPTLRRNRIGFIAFNPLAAGLLSGKHRPGGEVLAGRFKDNGNYLPRFYTDECFQGLERIRAACDKEGLSLVQATYSWLLMHSALLHGAKDGLLLGASSMPQLEENLSACVSAQALPPSVVRAIEDAWELAQGVSEGAFPYWRSYHRDQPGREDMHPGASYNAAKK